MRASHKVAAVFGDPNLVSVAGLVPVMRLAETAGLHDLLAEHLSVDFGQPGRQDREHCRGHARRCRLHR